MPAPVVAVVMASDWKDGALWIVMSGEGTFKDVGGKEDVAEFALSRAEGGSGLGRQLKAVKACFEHSHLQGGLMFPPRVCIANNPSERLRP